MRTWIPALTFLAACAGDLDPVDPDAAVDTSPIRACEVRVVAPLPEGVTRAEVAGTFSDWSPRALLDDDGDGVGEASLGRLQPGTYGYKLIWDGTYEGPPPVDVLSTWNDGIENRALVVGDCTRPRLETTAAQASPDGTVQATFRWSRGRDGAALDLEATTASIGDEPVEVEVFTGGELRVVAEGLEPGKHSVRVRAYDVDGREAEGSPAFVPLWVEEQPFAWADGVLYFAFVDRFRDGGPAPAEPIVGASTGAGYRGGDLVGLRDALLEGELDDLGVRSIWINPVAENPDGAWDGANPSERYTGYHGYWPAAPRTVEERLGTVDVPADQALREVVEAAHDRGIRIVLDVVLNHVHQDHPWVAEHPDWFDLQAPCVCGDPGCGWEERPRTCRFAPYLPDVEYRNQAAVDAMIDEAWWWIRTYDLDGLRVDAAKHMDHVILRTLSHTLRQRVTTPGGAHVYLVGETFTGAGQQDLIARYIGPHELDGQFDFPLYWRIREAVRDDGSFRPMAAEIAAGEAAYGDQIPWMSPFFGNHDIPRIATELAGCSDWGALWGACEDVLADGPADTVTGEQARIIDRIALAWAVVATHPGPPLLYYGDEIGLAGGGDPDNRRDMIWDDRTEAQLALRDRIAELGRIRASDPALQRGERRELWVDDDLYVVARVTDQGDVTLAWMSRRSDGGRRVPVPDDILSEGDRLDALIGDGGVTVSGGAVTLPTSPWSYGVLRLP